MVPVRLRKSYSFTQRRKQKQEFESTALSSVRTQGQEQQWGENSTQHVEEKALHPSYSSVPPTFSHHLLLKTGCPTVWGSMENVFSSQISINQHTLIFSNYLHTADLILKSWCDLKNVSPICQTCIIYEGPFTQGLWSKASHLWVFNMLLDIPY